MPYLCLLLSGAALLINGLAILTRISPRDGAVFSLMVGATQVALGMGYVGTSDGSDPHMLLSAAGMFLFGLTYLYVGLTDLLRLDATGLGWFSGFVCLFGLMLASEYWSYDPLLAVLWMCWACLWMLFFIRMVTGREGVAHFTGWALVLISQATTTVPSFLGMTGHWPQGWGYATGTAAAFSVLLVTAWRLSRKNRRRHPRTTSAEGENVSAVSQHSAVSVSERQEF